MVARAMNAAGVYSGAVCDHNEEALYAVYLNEFFLREAVGSWWQPPEAQVLQKVLTEAAQDLDAAGIFGTHLKHPSGRVWRQRMHWNGPWLIKDPRLCLTLPWWYRVFPEAKVIWVLRDEEAVVNSLLRRQGKRDEAKSHLTPELARALVRTYNDRAGEHVRNLGCPVMTVRYEDLTSSDVALQRMTWYALYQFCGVRPGRLEGFSPKNETVKEKETVSADAVKDPVSPLPTHGPLVSVIVPNYNHAPYLDERITSILNQTYQNIEVLLMDDLSPDHSRDVLRSWAEKDERITLMFNAENSGSPFAQWQRGARWARGKYLWIAESDDYAAPDLLALHVQALESNERAVMAYSHSHLVDERSEFLRDFRDDYAFIFGNAARWSHDFTANGPQEVANYLVHSNTVPNASGVLFRKEVFDRVGAPETTWRLNGDWLFYARMLQHGDLVFFAQPRNFFRFHTQTQRSRAIASYKAFDEILAMYDIFEREGWVDPEVLRAAKGKVATWWAGNVFSMKWNRDTLRNNIRLYKEFSQYKKNLLPPVLFNGFIKLVGQAAEFIGLKPLLKKWAARLFPKTFFAH